MKKLRMFVAMFGVMALVLGLAGTGDAGPMLVSHYTFDGSTADSVTGTVGTVRSGVVGTVVSDDSAVSAGYTSGPAGFGQAIEFGTSGGQTTYLDIGTGGQPNSSVPAGASVSVLQQGGVAFWIKTEDETEFVVSGIANTSGVNDTFFQIRANRGGADNQLFLFVREVNDSDGTLGSVRAIANPGWDWQDGAWHHIAVTWDAASATKSDAKMWINGNAMTVSDLGDGVVDETPVFTPHDFPLLIGAINARDKLSNPFTGALSDYRVYAGELTDADVVAIQADTSGTAPTLILPQNHGFESPVFANDGYEWIVSLDEGDKAAFAWEATNGVGLSGADNPWKSTSDSPDSAGDQFVYIRNNGARISQEINGFEVGATYDVRFYEAYRVAGGRASGDQLKVWLDWGLDTQQEIYFNPLVNTDWTLRFTDEFIAQKDTYTLTFEGIENVGGDLASLIDGVVIRMTDPAPLSNAAPIAEPASLGLLGLALLGLRKRRS